MAVATSFATPNFSGMLFRKGRVNTPFSTMIGARPLVTNHVEFTCGQYYNTEPKDQVFASLKKNIKISKETVASL